MSINDQFQQALDDVKKLSTKPDNDTLLSLYALYKQASEGDVSGKRPGMLDMTKRAKFDAWAKLKGLDCDTAKQRYVEKVNSLL